MHIGCIWEAYGEDFLRYGAFSNMPEEKIDVYTDQARRECLEKLDFLVEKMNVCVGKDIVDYLRPKVHLVKGKPSIDIPLMVKKYNVDLIVMGTVARTGIPGFIIGNTAESILEQVRCSVLAIKPDGFKSPIILN
jgi:nucleotide-binding universal stress UspA family protein